MTSHYPPTDFKFPPWYSADAEGSNINFPSSLVPLKARDIMTRKSLVRIAEASMNGWILVISATMAIGHTHPRLATRGVECPPGFYATNLLPTDDEQPA
jgi:hypothetical protein